VLPLNIKGASRFLRKWRRPPLTSSLRKHSGQQPRARQRAWPGSGAIPCTVRAVMGQIPGAAARHSRRVRPPTAVPRSTRYAPVPLGGVTERLEKRSNRACAECVPKRARLAAAMQVRMCSLQVCKTVHSAWESSQTEGGAATSSRYCHCHVANHLRKRGPAIYRSCSGPVWRRSWEPSLNRACKHITLTSKFAIVTFVIIGASLAASTV